MLNCTAPRLLADPPHDILRGPAGSSSLCEAFFFTPLSSQYRVLGLLLAPSSSPSVLCTCFLLPLCPQCVSPFRRDYVSLIALSLRSLALSRSEHMLSRHSPMTDR